MKSETFLDEAEKKRAYSKEYYSKNKEKKAEYGRDYRINNSESKKEYLKEYRAKNAVKIKEGKKEYYSRNTEKIIADSINYQKKRRQTDPLFRLISNLRTRVCEHCHSIRLQKKHTTIQALGCNMSEFKEYMQSKFKDGMTWDNYGSWHVDHIKPISLATNEEEVMTLNHYTNLQPLWKHDNFLKGNKYD